MSETSRAETLVGFLSALFGPSPVAALDHLETPDRDLDPAMLRLAALSPGNDMLWFYRVSNLWKNHGSPALKPQPVSGKALLLTDFTAAPCVPLISIMSAARGVHVDIELPPFDSVEPAILGPASSIYTGTFDVFVLWLSHHWLNRHLGRDGLVADDRIEQVTATLDALIGTVLDRSSATLLVANFPQSPVTHPGGQLHAHGRTGWAQATAEVNRWLARRAGPRVAIADLATASIDAGGRFATGLSNHLRARMVMEPAGQVAASREIASALAHLSGKGPRAIVTDWDNTLWGGEVADAGREGIVCGPDTPDGRGYLLVQQFIKSLRAFGVLLAGATRNQPGVEQVFEHNDSFALTLDDFAAISVGLGAKSAAIERLSADLGFGTDYLVYLDDSVFDLAEVLSVHPFVDVVRADANPEATLQHLAGARLFNPVAISAEDLQRAEAAGALKAQRVLSASVGSLDEFLGRIAIRVTASPMSDANEGRIEQLFQKTNQFNLTTKRYSRADLQRLRSDGATITAFSYEDAFGPQGIIAVVVLRSRDRGIHIDSWLMSCRVLNRTVEFAIFEWIRQQGGGPITGEFHATEKNGLVKDLYARLGFQPDGGQWRFDGYGADHLPPAHYVAFTEVSIS